MSTIKLERLDFQQNQRKKLESMAQQEPLEPYFKTFYGTPKLVLLFLDVILYFTENDAGILAYPHMMVTLSYLGFWFWVFTNPSNELKEKQYQIKKEFYYGLLSTLSYFLGTLAAVVTGRFAVGIIGLYITVLQVLLLCWINHHCAVKGWVLEL